MLYYISDKSEQIIIAPKLAPGHFSFCSCLTATKRNPRSYSQWLGANTCVGLLFDYFFDYVLQDTAWSATIVSLSKTGLTVMRINKRLPVLVVQTAVEKPLWPESKVVHPFRSTLKAAAFRLHVMVINLSCASLLIPQSPSPSARLIAALVICAMEPKYQWSAPSCFWHAFLWLSFVKCSKLLTFNRKKRVIQ